METVIQTIDGRPLTLTRGIKYPSGVTTRMRGGRMKRPDEMSWQVYDYAAGTATVQGMYRGHYADFIVRLDALLGACRLLGTRDADAITAAMARQTEARTA